MKTTTLALAALILLPGFAAASAATLDGTWHVTGSVADNPVNPTCVFAEKEGKLTGTCTGTDGKAVALTGTVKDKAVAWQYETTYQGGAITVIFTGSLDKEDHLTGAIDVEPFAVSGDFTAAKEKAAPATPPATPPAAAK